MRTPHFIFLAVFLIGVSATAGTITVMGTLAVAGANEDSLFATYTNTNGNNSAKSIAAVTAGHVGAAFSAVDGYPGATDAEIVLQLAFDNMTEDDFLLLGMSLDGSFGSAIGAGSGLASLLVDDGTSVTNVASISCSASVGQSHGVPCYPSASQQVMIPLVNTDSLTITWELQLGATVVPAFADFYNSLDASITVPTGTTILNNPGGTLFQTQGSGTPVPEPNSVSLIGSGFLMVVLLAARRSRRRADTRERSAAKN